MRLSFATWNKVERLAGAAYVGLLVAALTVDFLGDRSFGSTMMAVVPIGLVAGMCLLAGPWLLDEHRAAAARCWAYGTGLVGLITIAFTLLGPEQARTAETVFTYAALLLAFPASLLIPLTYAVLGSLMPESVIGRVTVVGLAVCFLAVVQWRVVALLRGSDRS